MTTISHVKLSPTLVLTEDHHGFWLWDETRGMNLAMKARSERDAFVEALDYYQSRLLQVEEELKSLSEKVEKFVNQFKEEEK